MALTIRPTDGLVHRLLQQQSRSPAASTASAQPKEKASDKVSISGQARQQNNEAPVNSTPSYGYKQQDLESQLLRLYTHHDNNSGSKG
ncbi:MAG: hypothetical protein R8M45_09130 [Ghiorsea sp.]